MEGLKSILMKKKAEGKMLDPMKAKAKGGVLQELIDDMHSMDGDKIKGLKQVTVAAPSEEGLKEGLEKAEELVENPEEMMGEVEEVANVSESDEGEEDEESILAQIEELKSKLKNRHV